MPGDTLEFVAKASYRVGYWGCIFCRLCYAKYNHLLYCC